MSNSNELSTRLIQSLPTEYSQAVSKYGEQYALFLEKYPTLQNRTDTITSIYDSVDRGGMSFVEVDKYFKDGASEFWITPSELTRFFYEFSMGEYGEIYVGKTVNPQILFIALEKYMCKVYEKRAEIDGQRNRDKQKIEDEKAKMNAISYEEYCLRKGVDPKVSPLEELKQKLEKESKRNDGNSRKMQ